MTDVALGLIASVVTELLKYFPWLNKNELSRALTAIVVLIIGTFITNGGWSWSSFSSAVVYALASYKAIVQPLAVGAGLSTQKSV